MINKRIEALLSNIKHCTPKCQDLILPIDMPIEAYGTDETKVMLVGEAPSLKSIETNKFWSGRTGVKVRSIFERDFLLEQMFYLTTVVKCGIPKTRIRNLPTEDEINRCGDKLTREIDYLKPEYIVTFGEKAFLYFINKYGLHFTSLKDVQNDDYCSAIKLEKNITLIPFHQVHQELTSEGSIKTIYGKQLEKIFDLIFIGKLLGENLFDTRSSGEKPYPNKDWYIQVIHKQIKYISNEVIKEIVVLPFAYADKFKTYLTSDLPLITSNNAFLLRTVLNMAYKRKYIEALLILYSCIENIINQIKILRDNGKPFDKNDKKENNFGYKIKYLVKESFMAEYKSEKILIDQRNNYIHGTFDKISEQDVHRDFENAVQYFIELLDAYKKHTS